jgi:hypothetical protein
MNPRSRRITQLVLISASLSAAPFASAALKDTPPEGVALSGTEWKIDPSRSEDPTLAIERAEQAAEDRANREADRQANRGTRGGVFDDDDNGPWGNDPRDPSSRDRTSRNGGWTTRNRNGSTTIDPTGGIGGITIGTGGAGRRGNEFMDQLEKSPTELAIVVHNKHITVLEDLIETGCDAGEKAPLADSYGDGERTCGWSGRTLVIETKRGKSHFVRTDRYELSKDGKTLSYVTSATGQDMPNIRISRTYTPVPQK